MIDKLWISAICNKCYHANNTFVRSNEYAIKEAQRQFHLFLKDRLIQDGYSAPKEDATKDPLNDEYKQEFISHGPLLEKHTDKKNDECIYKRSKDPHDCLVCSNDRTPRDRNKNAVCSMQLLDSCWLKDLHRPKDYSRDKYKPFVKNDEVETVQNKLVSTLEQSVKRRTTHQDYNNSYDTSTWILTLRKR